ncbi:MAG: vanadium-dependent haloperoxidase [Verrucomicrobia subdivision 3 bacterium]|nr:vanadium-dependent haloperoxidase [Limisphaerales bacterium]
MKILPAYLLTLFVSSFPGVASDGQHEAYGPLFSPNPELFDSPRHGPRAGLDVVRRWNQIAIDASGLDHTPVAPGENRIFGQQIGPGRASRAMAIVHIAMFDTINAVVGEYESFTGVRARPGPISLHAAISQAAHDTLAALFSSQAPSFDQWLAEDLAAVRNGVAKAKGISLGKRVAEAVLARKADDGSAHTEPRVGIDHETSELAGHWRQDPISLIPLALGAYWGACHPFVLKAPNQFRAPPPPAMGSPEYAAAFSEAKRLGGDGIITPTERTPEQTYIGTYWAYDGTPSLCAPPRLYNQITLKIADQMGSSPLELARLLALINVAMADAGIAVWESKYYYDFWRPITAIREADPGTGPTGSGDGNDATIGDLSFSPLGAPASNLLGPNFTPPFPAYPSGHAGFGGALFQTLRRFYGTDNISFTFVSDEFNGLTKDNEGNARPLIPRRFSSLSQAEEENGQSRIYLGIHWSFDKTEGIAQGRRVADFVFDNAFRPLHRRGL